MKKPKTLRMKLTIVTAFICVLMCLALTISVVLSIGMLTSAYNEALQTSPAGRSDTVDMNEAGTAAAPIQNEAIRNPVIQQAQIKFVCTITLSAITVIVLGVLSIYFYIKRQLMPLEALSREVGSLEAESLKAPLHTKPNNLELNQLVDSFNAMRTRVSDSYTMQKNFSGSAAHELRTPLAAMQAKLEVFYMKKDRTCQEYDQILDVVSSNNDRLISLVNELLELTQGTDVELCDTVGLRAAAEEAVIDLDPIMAQNGISASIEGEAVVNGNDCLLQRMVFNLIQNAVRYNVPGGSVKVRITQEGNGARLTVADTGAGIPDEMKAQIFEPFFRVDKSRSRELGGCGLGLPIVKQIVERHGGAIAVADNPGGGTVVIVELK